ncbi:MAG TPA: GNAT family N-acetyltransferase [Anaerolineales bacterium]|nr:GNAT family N-acetyltransferase [Anaerolineales bacterium]
MQILAPNDPAFWPDQLALSGGFAGFDSWMKFVEKVYGFPAYRIVARTGDQISGLLALTHIKHRIFGDHLITAPFASYGGFAFSSAEASDALLAKARGLANDLGVDYVNVRFEAGELTPPLGWVQQPLYATYLTDLTSDLDALLSSYSPDHRNHIRKSLKKGFGIKFGHLDLLDDAYEGLARSMHELGSPYHDKDYLRVMAESLGRSLEFAVVYSPLGKLAGAGVFIFQGRMVTNLHANILRDYRSIYAGEFLYWSVVARYSQRGFKVFDMGRSLIGSGNEVFKSKWKPKRQLLAYWYALHGKTSLPALNQRNPKFRIAIQTWKYLPAIFVRLMGPYLIKGLA